MKESDAELFARMSDEDWDAVVKRAIAEGIIQPTGKYQWSEKHGRFEPVYRVTDKE